MLVKKYWRMIDGFCGICVSPCPHTSCRCIFAAIFPHYFSTAIYRLPKVLAARVRLDDGLPVEKSKEVVKICTQYAQKGMLNIFIGIFSFALAFAFISGYEATGGATNAIRFAAASFFVSYLISIAIFGFKLRLVFITSIPISIVNKTRIVIFSLANQNARIVEA